MLSQPETNIHRIFVGKLFETLSWS